MGHELKYLNSLNAILSQVPHKILHELLNKSGALKIAAINFLIKNFILFFGNNIKTKLF